MVERRKHETGPLNAEQRKKLRGLVEEIERTEDEIDVLKEDLKGIYEAAKTDGFDVAALKETIRLRKKEPEQLDLFEQTVATYRAVVSQPPNKIVAGLKEAVSVVRGESEPARITEH